MICDFCDKDGLSNRGYKLHVKYAHPQQYNDETKEIISLEEDEDQESDTTEDVVEEQELTVDEEKDEQDGSDVDDEEDIDDEIQKYRVVKTGDTSIPVVADGAVYYLRRGSSVVVENIKNRERLGSAYRIDKV